MEEDVFSKIFTPEWEFSQPGDSFMKILSATYEDYLSDLSQWLGLNHYTKLMYSLLVQTVGRYLMTLRKRSNGAFTFTNEINAANKVLVDRTVLIDFFKNYLKDLERGGMRPETYVSKLPEEDGQKAVPNAATTESALYVTLEPMVSLTVVITVRQFSVGENDMKSLFKKFGIDGLRLVQACCFCNPVINRMDRQLFSDQAKKLFEDGNYNQTFKEEFLNFDVMNYNSLTGKSGESNDGGTGVAQPSVINSFFRMNFMGRKG